MPLGSTHDRITLWTLPLVTLTVGILSGRPSIALATGSSYLFSGLMFSGDLDTRSRQYQRWTLLRWLWLPYRKLCRHRSLWSHGLVIGTILRLLYLSVWIVPPLLATGWLGSLAQWWLWKPQVWSSDLWQLLQVHQLEILATLLGLELGSINHSLSDWLVSGWKRHRKARHSQSRPTPRSTTAKAKAVRDPSRRRASSSEESLSKSVRGGSVSRSRRAS